MIKTLFDIGKGALDLLGQLDGNYEKKKLLDIEIQKLMNEANSKILEAEKKAMDLQSKAILADSESNSWIQKNWRPITMITFLILIVLDSFNLLSKPLPGDAWSLLQLGLGGYVMGRSLEKITAKGIDNFKGVFKK